MPASDSSDDKVRISSLAKWMFARVIIFSFLMSLLAAAIWGYIDYRRSMEGLVEEFAKIETAYRESLVQCIWDYDRTQLQAIVKGIRSLPYISYVQVTAQGNMRAEAGTPGREGVVKRDFRLSRLHNDKVVTLGTLTVHADAHAVVYSVVKFLAATFVFQSIVVLLVATFFFVLFGHEVSRHLYAIADYVGRKYSDPDSPPLIIERKPADDEIGVVVSAINNSRHQLMASRNSECEALAALTESESRYRNIFEGSSAVMLLVSPGGGSIVDANPAAVEYYGYSREILRTMKISEINNAGDMVHACIDNVVSGGRQIFRFIHRLASGELRDVEVHCSPVTVKGEILLFSVIHDVTDQVKAWEEIRRLNTELEQRVLERTAQLEAANRELEAFSYSVSHDLQAPLRHIDGFSHMIEEDYFDIIDERGSHCLKRIRAGVVKMRNLINDLLEFSRIARVELINERFDLSAMVSECLEEMAVHDPGRKVETGVQQGITVEADPRLMRVVMQNLLGNAWKYTSKKDQASIQFGMEFKDGRKVFFVRDNGAGFDMAHAGNLFNVFQRLHSESEYDGTGVGLATVQRIILRHGGSVWADAREGEGATFRFSLG